MARIAIGLNAVIVAVTDEVPRILTVRRAADGTAAAGLVEEALPFGPLEPETDRTLDRGLRRWVCEQTGLALGYVEQLYTFGDRDREWPEGAGGTRVVSVGYLALVREREAAVAGEAHWLDVYGFLPWEDWRGGRPRVIDEAIAPALERWVEFVQKGQVKGREVVSIIPQSEIDKVQKDTPPHANSSKVEMLKGGEYVRLWINKGGNHYLVHLPA